MFPRHGTATSARGDFCPDLELIFYSRCAEFGEQLWIVVLVDVIAETQRRDGSLGAALDHAK